MFFGKTVPCLCYAVYLMVYFVLPWLIRILAVLKFYLLLTEGDEILSWLIGVELIGVWEDVKRDLIGVDVFESNGVDNILFLRDSGPCIWS